MRDRLGLVFVAVLALVVFVTGWVARSGEGQRAIRDCDAAIARADYAEAIVQARTAADARCPLCAAPETGYARLLGIAKDGETRADVATALAAWRAVRAATLSTSVIETRSDRRDHADSEIARLGHRVAALAAAESGAPVPAAADETRLRSALREDDGPGGIVFAIVGLGGALFLVAALRIGGVVSRSAKPTPSTNLALGAIGILLAAAGAFLF